MTGGMALYLAIGITIGIFCIKTLPQRKDVISPLLALAMLAGFAWAWPMLLFVGLAMWLASPSLR